MPQYASLHSHILCLTRENYQFSDKAKNTLAHI